MKARRFVIVFVPLCAGLGCLAFAVALVDTDSPVPLPPPFLFTRAAQPLPLLPPPTPLADSPAITIAAAPYRHPSGAFTIAYPESWQIDEAEDSAQFTAPDDMGRFSVTFEVGEAATHADYEAGLRSTWGDLGAFSIETVDSTGLPNRWSATFTFEQTLLPDQNRVRVIGQIIEQPQGSVLYTFTALEQADYRGVLDSVMQSIANSLQTDPDAAIGNSE